MTNKFIEKAKNTSPYVIAYYIIIIILLIVYLYFYWISDVSIETQLDYIYWSGIVIFIMIFAKNFAIPITKKRIIPFIKNILYSKTTTPINEGGLPQLHF